MVYEAFYRITVLIYRVIIQVGAFFNAKARLWVAGRKNWKLAMETKMVQFPSATTHPRIWMHAASLGEYEQGKEVALTLKAKNANFQLVVTCFSPSGYEIIKKDTLPDWVTYLPLDTPKNAAEFIALLQPSLVLWIKYEFWFYFLREIHFHKIPLLLVSGIFRPTQLFFHPAGVLHRKMLQFFTHVFVQDAQSFSLVETILPKNSCSISGDTRFDRVMAIARHWQPLPLIEKWLENKQLVIVAGSTWPDDEILIANVLHYFPNINWIIAPHHIDRSSLEKTRKLFPNSILFSQWQREPTNHQHQVLIIDNIGMLSRLYHYADISWIGGGFSKGGIHNVLEAAVYGKPVLHGPNFEKYAEAKALSNAKGSFIIHELPEITSTIKSFIDIPDFYNNTCKNAATFTTENSGAVKKIIDWIQENLRLTN